MRILGTIPHPTFKIVAYTIERYFYIEIEAGPMKQCYKLHKEQVDGLEGVKKWLDEDFLAHLQHTFETMYKSHQASVNRNFPK
ncbi:hypothetical protein Oweho_0629 [Owenweeksia hongkongensis DSM 17368]|uniref:Uncharacterized protein n=1 Tax=Owenweeksia hongkongensis (strain DSM 17368 / CIP 108786 / JCM 12287 / NRRL B-23963 / UST20020801) TaxID=926562 RepID=G8R0X2_OWEHD|nr:hypothetical protein [Owenweeksia hongkongensis]AEV31643.1 hypothetical protein Oweho_0629 [Owenweeksia hongkongensis DSM 17368]